MKIVMFSINPIFPHLITGGASKHLYHIARHLGALGHQVEILCAQPNERLDPFTWADNVRVYPVLPFKIPFPQPYAISGADLALIVQRLSDALGGADRFYIHDGEFLLPDIYAHIPTIASFRDNVYPESVLGSFVGKFDDLICVSEYSAEVIINTAGRFYPGLRQRIHQVNNGIDFKVFSPVDSSTLAEELGVDPETETLLLHPHRPEPGKGLPETIQVVEQLVHHHGLRKVRVLVPEWIGSMVSTGETDFYNNLIHMMDESGVRENFQFIPWMPAERMPELYSLGDVTLCLGNIVEAFGNVAYESLACGTPSIVAKAGVHRSLLPDALIDKVPYGDISAAVEGVLALLKNRRGVSEAVFDAIKEKFDFNHQVGTYAEIITNCRKKEPVQFSHPVYSEESAYSLAPWCYLEEGQIYHDFRGRFEPAGELAGLLQDYTILTYCDAQQQGVSEEVWSSWIDRTYIVPNLEEREG